MKYIILARCFDNMKGKKADEGNDGYTFEQNIPGPESFWMCY